MQAKKFTLLLFFMFIFNSYSQISFEKGYFINNVGEKTDCLIKNLDWNSNPTSFDYKLTDNSDVLNNTITNIQEFGITNISKYKRVKVKIDRTGGANNELNFNRFPVFTEEILFLKTLINGKASLFSYVEGSLSLYFFSVDNSNIEQLVYKSYYLDNTTIQENIQYKQQLINSLICDRISNQDFTKLEYQKDKLIDCFLKFNNCVTSTVDNYEVKSKRDAINISLRPGVSMSSMSFYTDIDKNLKADFGNKTTFRFGVEFEYVFPFNKNKWALIVEPTYQYFIAEQLGSLYNIKIDYKVIDAWFGVRHYMFLNDKSKLFINGAFVNSISLNSKIAFNNNINNANYSIDIRPATTVSFGFGYRYINKFSVEFRYGLEQDLLGNYRQWYSSYNLSSLVFGYTIF
ncbi:tRNA modification GTPase [Flavobacterium sp.]|uniref:tRNA modification GTPase n=1 Tax=Flavobacterium sp. TaxID=239 RepID=UPI0037521533